MFHIGHNLINRKTEITMNPLKISLFLFNSDPETGRSLFNFHSFQAYICQIINAFLFNSNPENLFRLFIQSMHLANFELRFFEETSERRLPGYPGQMFFPATHALADLVCQNNKKFRL